ncbi:MAG: hypothetical protein GX626_10980 [Spirochaetales bacterium]|jgi:hypothetical protein|nr:hypothetical protein [Spirochaetales bacterium]
MDQQKGNLPTWYDRMLSSAPLMVFFVLCVLVCSPILLLYGALSPLLRR